MLEKLKAAEDRYEEISLRLTDPSVVNDNSQYRSLMKEYKDLTPLVTKYRELAAAQQVLSAAPEDFDTRIKAIEEEITEKKIVMKDVILYMSKRAELTFSKLALNRVKISLYDVVKTTGELKDVFRFTYNGRRYDRLSLSEKIRAGAEVSELVKRLTGRNYPVFFDNMESVDDLSNIRPTSQLILAKCVHNAELSVRAGSTAMPKAA